VKTVVITGAARGVGRATACALAARASRLMLVDACMGDAAPHYPLATREDLEFVEAECRRLGATTVRPVTADVREAEAVANLADYACDAFGTIDALVNAAGVIGSPKVADLISEDDWSWVVETNLTGPWRVAKSLLPLMTDAGDGSIVNVASTAGVVAFPSFASYVASKHGLVGLTRALALDYAPRRIRVNAVCPTSIIPTDARSSMLGGVAAMLGISLEDYVALTLPNHPLTELPTDQDVAAAIVWLVADARHVTGAVIPVDNGFSIR
jgi:NAD(P)-dependent dehydrogenase (short-subunit alcohol dehydrogenase family)